MTKIRKKTKKLNWKLEISTREWRKTSIPWEPQANYMAVGNLSDIPNITRMPILRQMACFCFSFVIYFWMNEWRQHSDRLQLCKTSVGNVIGLVKQQSIKKIQYLLSNPNSNSNKMYSIMDGNARNLDKIGELTIYVPWWNILIC